MALDYKSSLGRYRRYLQLVQTQPLWAASMWVIMSLVLLIVLVILALRPTLVTISGLFGELRQQKEISAKLDEKILKVRRAIDEMESVKNDLPLLQQILPEQADWDILADDLYKAATESGLDILSISVEKIPLSPSEIVVDQQQAKPLMPQGLISIRFSIAAKGNEQQIRNTILALQEMKRLILFSDVSIEEDKDGRLNLNASGEVGYIPDKYLL
jgi:Tfp pilus assembly protein PilO